MWLYIHHVVILRVLAWTVDVIFAAAAAWFGYEIVCAWRRAAATVKRLADPAPLPGEHEERLYDGDCVCLPGNDPGTLIRNSVRNCPIHAIPCTDPVCSPEDGWCCRAHHQHLMERASRHRLGNPPLDDMPAGVIARVVTDLEDKRRRP